MNQQQLTAIKARAEAAVIASIPPANLEKVTVMGEFRTHALKDVLALVDEVERLRAENEQLKAKVLELQLEVNSSNEVIDELVFPDFDED